MTSVYVEAALTVAVVVLSVLAGWRRPKHERLVDVFPAPLSTGRPATRIGRTVIFEGGRTVRLSLADWALFALGIRTHLSTRTKERRSL